MKKFIKVTAVILVFVMLFTACSPAGGGTPAGGTAAPAGAATAPAGGATADAPVTITLLTGIFNGGHNTIVDVFNETFDHIQIDLNNTAASWEDISTQKITMVAAGMGPDITTVSTSFYPQFAAQGLLLDITDYMTANIDRDSIHWSVIENLFIDGRLFGLPISVFSLIVYYNRDMFEAAGIEAPSLDWNNTWTKDEWFNIAAQLTHGEGMDRVYGGWADIQLERTACFLFPLGLDYWREGDLFPQFDNRQIRDIHEVVFHAMHTDRIIPDGSTIMTAPVAQLFADERLAMMINGTWMHPAILESGINFGVAPTPGGVTVSYIDVYIPYANTRHPEATKEVMHWLIGEVPSSIKYQEFTWGPQVCKLATEYNMDILFQGLTQPEKDMIFNSLAQGNSRPLTVFPEWAEFLTASLLPISSLMRIGEYSVDDAFDRLQEEALTILGLN